MPLRGVCRADLRSAEFETVNIVNERDVNELAFDFACSWHHGNVVQAAAHRTLSKTWPKTILTGQSLVNTLNGRFLWPYGVLSICEISPGAW